MEGSSSFGLPEEGGLPRPRLQGYNLIRCLGRGRSGEVWMARHVSGLWHAIKVVRRIHVENASAYERAYRLLWDYAPISRSHESFLAVAHVGREEQGRHGLFYGVMELADSMPGESARMEPTLDEEELTSREPLVGSGLPFPGSIDPMGYRPKSLRHWLEFSSGPHPRTLSLPECIRLGLTLIAALEVLHGRGLVHGRIRPANILYVNGQPKLAEIALVPRTVCAGHSFAIEDDRYDPPEGPGTIQADLYSLGKVLQEARDGRSRPPASGPETIRDAPVPSMETEARWKEILRKACGNVSGISYQGASQMREDLAGLRVELTMNQVK